MKTHRPRRRLAVAAALVTFLSGSLFALVGSASPAAASPVPATGPALVVCPLNATTASAGLIPRPCPPFPCPIFLDGITRPCPPFPCPIVVVTQGTDLVRAPCFPIPVL